MKKFSAVFPFVVVFLTLVSLITVGASLNGDEAFAASVKKNAPAHGHGTVSSNRLNALTTSDSISFDCDWWGGTVMPFIQNTVILDAYGECSNISLTWNSWMRADTSSMSQKTNEITATGDHFTQATPSWGPIGIGQSVNWAWESVMSVPDGMTWTHTDDPSHCAIQPNPQVVVCYYSGGGVIPFPVYGTSTPTPTPAPTFTTVPECTTVYAWLVMMPKSPRTLTVQEEDTFVINDTGAAIGEQFDFIERTLQWRNLTTGASGRNIVNVPIDPEPELVFYNGQIGLVGNGTIVASFVADIRLSDGVHCTVSASANVDN